MSVLGCVKARTSVLAQTTWRSPSANRIAWRKARAVSFSSARLEERGLPSASRKSRKIPSHASCPKRAVASLNARSTAARSEGATGPTNRGALSRGETVARPTIDRARREAPRRSIEDRRLGPGPTLMARDTPDGQRRSTGRTECGARRHILRKGRKPFSGIRNSVAKTRKLDFAVRPIQTFASQNNDPVILNCPLVTRKLWQRSCEKAAQARRGN